MSTAFLARARGPTELSFELVFPLEADEGATAMRTRLLLSLVEPVIDPEDMVFED